MVNTTLLSPTIKDASIESKINQYIPGVIYQYETNFSTAKSRFTYISPRSIDVFEYPAEAVIADENVIWAMMHPDDLGKIVASVSEATQNNIPWRDEFRILTPSGQTKWIQGQSEPDTTTVDVALHNGIFFDITDRKNAEAEVQAFADRQTLLNQISNQIRNSLDIDAIISNALNATRAFLKVDCCAFGWFTIEAEKSYWDIIQQSKHEDLPSALGRYSRDWVGPVDQILFEKNLLVIDDVSQYPEPIHQKFLESIHCQSELLFLITTQSQRMGILICTHHVDQHAWSDREVEFLKAICDQLAIAISQADLYQQSQAKSQQLEKTLKKLKETQSQVIQSEKMSSLGHLVAGIAHEINNPVNFIHGNITHAHQYTQDLLDLIQHYQETYPTPPAAIAQQIEDIDLEFLQTDLPKTLSSMKMGTERIREIVKSLRNFSRIDEIGAKAVDIHEGIDSTLLILQNRLGKEDGRNPIAIEKHYGTLPLIECFAGQLNQVFMNILANAMDALEEEPAHPAGKITITTAIAADDGISIVIHDNGPGIPPEIQPKIFDPFFTTKPIGKGTGMGMSISYQIITETHGGTLTLHSTPETGTSFTITIPSQLQS
jgi:two-component system, NtrC family, sensor kinase